MSVAEAGDIILTRTALRPTNLFIPGHWSHAQMIGFGHEGTTVEATLPVVRLSTMVDIWASASEVIVVRVKGMSRRQRYAAYGHAIDYLGRPYDTSFQYGDDAFYCSELIVRSLMNAGAPFDIDDLAVSVAGKSVVPPQAFTGEFFEIIYSSKQG